MFSEESKEWTTNVMRLPGNVQKFDILCNHLIFEENAIRAAMYPDTVFTGSVRHPFLIEESRASELFEYLLIVAKAVKWVLTVTEDAT
nr:hypothetical protein BaRGS_035037 [Batillaria attramentaria]